MSATDYPINSIGCAINGRNARIRPARVNDLQTRADMRITLNLEGGIQVKIASKGPLAGPLTARGYLRKMRKGLLCRLYSHMAGFARYPIPYPQIPDILDAEALDKADFYADIYADLNVLASHVTS